MPNCSATTTSRRWRCHAPPDATSARSSAGPRRARAAGGRAHALYAFAAAERFYSDALALWPQDAKRERAELIHRRAWPPGSG